jgi:hypothetical protein
VPWIGWIAGRSNRFITRNSQRFGQDTLAAARPRPTGSTTQAADPPPTTSCRGRRPQCNVVAKPPGERYGSVLAHCGPHPSLSLLSPASNLLGTQIPRGLRLPFLTDPVGRPLSPSGRRPPPCAAATPYNRPPAGGSFAPPRGPTTSRRSLAGTPPSSSCRPRDTSAHRGSSHRCSATRSHGTE